MADVLDVLIIRRTNVLLLNKGQKEAFAASLREQYERTAPVAQRTIKWSDNDVLSTRRDNDRKHLQRYLDRETKLPAELSAAWLLTLPDSDRRWILSEFLEQFDATLMPLKRDTSASLADATALAALMRETGEAVEAIAPMLANGVLGPEDAHLARRALQKLIDVQRVVIDWQARVTAILPGDK